jgi:hypothetical protein
MPSSFALSADDILPAADVVDAAIFDPSIAALAFISALTIVPSAILADVI